MGKKKILIFSTLSAYPFWEGSEMLWYNFITNETVREKINSHVVLAESPATREKGKALGALGIKTDFYTPYGARFIARNLLKTAQKLGFFDETYAFWYKKIESVKPDLVFFNLAKAEDYVLLDFATRLCRKRDIPYWLVLQGAPDFYFDGDEKSDARFRQVVEGARKNIFQSEKNRICIEKAVGKHLTNYFVTRNGLTPDFINKARETAKKHPVRTEGKVKILSLGRIQPTVKGQHILLETLSLPVWKKRDWEINFVGGGEKFLLRRFIEYYEIAADKVKITDKVADVFPFIGDSDLMLVPSVFEGTPLTAVEGMACARIVVGTPAGAMPEVIIDGETGWLADAVSVEAFSRAMERAWTARKSWAEVGERARRKIAVEYNQANYIPKLLEILLEDLKVK